MNNQFDWDNYPNESKFISTNLQNKFSQYFNLSGGYSANIIELANDISKLNRNELSLLLKLKRTTTRKKLVEIILEALPKTDPRVRTLYLHVVDFIIKNDPVSKVYFYEHVNSLTPFAEAQDSQIKNLAISILKSLETNFELPTPNQYVFNKNSEYDHYLQISKILKKAVTHIWIWDNYVDENIVAYIRENADISKIREIKILTDKNKNNRVSKIKMEKDLFTTQFSQIRFELKHSESAHDRYVITKNETWLIGTSIQAKSKKITSIVLLDEEQAKDNIAQLFNDTWIVSTMI